MEPRDVVSQFIADIRAQRWENARALFATEGFEYVGPNMRLTTPDDVISYQFAMAAIQKDIVVRQISVEGDQVHAILDYQTYYEPIGDVRLALWFTVRDGHIVHMESFYNAAVVENMLSVDGPFPPRPA